MTKSARGVAPASGQRPQGVRAGHHSADEILDRYEAQQRAEALAATAKQRAEFEKAVGRRVRELRLKYYARMTVLDKHLTQAAKLLIDLEQHLRGGASVVGYDAFKGVLVAHLDRIYEQAAREQLYQEASSHEAD